jgi:signal transduction histidine kinase
VTTRTTGAYGAALEAVARASRADAELTTLRRFARGIAHDLNNVLTPLCGACEILARSSDPAARSVSLMRRSARRAMVLADRLQRFAERPALSPERVRLNEVVHAFAAAGRQLDAGLCMEVAAAATADAILADRRDLERLLEELVTNAAEAMPGGGRIRIETADAADRAGRCVVLSVRDEGAERVSPDDWAPTPGALAKAGSLRMGLGLAIVCDVAHGLEAQLSVVPVAPRGTAVEVRIPLA